MPITLQAMPANTTTNYNLAKQMVQR